jgi:hypothetical protein
MPLADDALGPGRGDERHVDLVQQALQRGLVPATARSEHDQRPPRGAEPERRALYRL